MIKINVCWVCFLVCGFEGVVFKHCFLGCIVFLLVVCFTNRSSDYWRKLSRSRYDITKCLL